MDVPSPGISYIPSDFPYSGALATDGLPSFNAVRVEIFPVEARYPYKSEARLAGCVEAQQSGGNLTAPALTAWQTFANFFHTTWTTAGSGIWVPVLHSLVYPDDNQVQIAVVDTRITTQNSRKIGRGA